VTIAFPATIAFLPDWWFTVQTALEIKRMLPIDSPDKK
jgi:hypothetical protein